MQPPYKWISQVSFETFSLKRQSHKSFDYRFFHPTTFCGPSRHQQRIRSTGTLEQLILFVFEFSWRFPGKVYPGESGFPIDAYTGESVVNCGENIKTPQWHIRGMYLVHWIMVSMFFANFKPLSLALKGQPFKRQSQSKFEKWMEYLVKSTWTFIVQCWRPPLHIINRISQRNFFQVSKVSLN